MELQRFARQKPKDIAAGMQSFCFKLRHIFLHVVPLYWMFGLHRTEQSVRNANRLENMKRSYLPATELNQTCTNEIRTVWNYGYIAKPKEDALDDDAFRTLLKRVPMYDQQGMRTTQTFQSKRQKKEQNWVWHPFSQKCEVRRIPTYKLVFRRIKWFSDGFRRIPTQDVWPKSQDLVGLAFADGFRRQIWGMMIKHVCWLAVRQVPVPTFEFVTFHAPFTTWNPQYFENHSKPSNCIDPILAISKFWRFQYCRLHSLLGTSIFWRPNRPSKQKTVNSIHYLVFNPSIIRRPQYTNKL